MTSHLMSQEFRSFLYPRIPQIARHFGTPFHIHDERGIRGTIDRMQNAFAGIKYGNFYAVKALPVPEILVRMRQMGFGFDCSSIPELMLARWTGASGEEIMFTSNNTSDEEFKAALLGGGCILNLDDVTMLRRLKRLPELICFRYNPGKRRTGNSIIGNPHDSKYGITHEQFVPAYREAKRRGVKRFGIHTMVCSNELRGSYMIETVRMLLDLCGILKKELGIECEFINMGGGFGVPYRPDQSELPLEWMAGEIVRLIHNFGKGYGYEPKLYSECGRYVTGPHGVLVSRIITDSEKYHRFIGVDSGMSALMRPGMYGAYHHVEILDSRGRPCTGPRQRMSVVGSICENCDRHTAKPRLLPRSARVGGFTVTYTTGAHASAMAFNYNGRLRIQELLRDIADSVYRIRRGETTRDLFATLYEFDKHRLEF